MVGWLKCLRSEKVRNTFGVSGGKQCCSQMYSQKSKWTCQCELGVYDLISSLIWMLRPTDTWMTPQVLLRFSFLFCFVLTDICKVSLGPVEGAISMQAIIIIIWSILCVLSVDFYVWRQSCLPLKLLRSVFRPQTLHPPLHRHSGGEIMRETSFFGEPSL